MTASLHPFLQEPLPLGWNVRTVDQIKSTEKHACVAGPFGSSISSKFFVEHGVPIVRGSNLTLGLERFITNNFAFIAPEKAATFSAQTVVAEDLIFTCWGTIGQVGYVPINGPYERYVISNKQLKLRVNREIVEPLFAYYFFASQQSVDFVKSQAIGSAVPGINLGILKGLPILVPPIQVQREVVKVLSAYDDLIENNTRRIAILEDMARRLFDEWFGRDANYGMPDPVRIDALIDFDPKTKVAKEGLKPFLPMPCVPTNSMVVSQWEEREGNAGSKFLNGDTLMARITPCLENGKTAFVDFLPDGTAGFGSTEFIVMRGRVVPPEFVYCLARSEAFREHAIKSMSGATGRQRVSSAAVAQFEIASPHPERLDKFGETARPMFSMVRSLANANTNLRTTRDLLLPKLISGQIEVRAAEKELEAVAA